jgi:hypothetical protein
MARHGAHYFPLIRREIFLGRLAAQQNNANELFVYNKRCHETQTQFIERADESAAEALFDQRELFLISQREDARRCRA